MLFLLGLVFIWFAVWNVTNLIKAVPPYRVEAEVVWFEEWGDTETIGIRVEYFPRYWSPTYWRARAELKRLDNLDPPLLRHPLA